MTFPVCTRIDMQRIVKDSTLSELEVQLSDYCPYADAVITDTYDPETKAWNLQWQKRSSSRA